MVAVPWPVVTSPGQSPQEGSGRLINIHMDSRQNNAGVVWRRAPGAKVFAREASFGTAIGSATALGVSSVGETQGQATGSATANAVGQSV